MKELSETLQHQIPQQQQQESSRSSSGQQADTPAANIQQMGLFQTLTEHVDRGGPKEFYSGLIQTYAGAISSSSVLGQEDADQAVFSGGQRSELEAPSQRALATSSPVRHIREGEHGVERPQDDLLDSRSECGEEVGEAPGYEEVDRAPESIDIEATASDYHETVLPDAQESSEDPDLEDQEAGEAQGREYQVEAPEPGDQDDGADAIFVDVGTKEVPVFLASTVPSTGSHLVASGKFCNLLF